MVHARGGGVCATRWYSTRAASGDVPDQMAGIVKDDKRGAQIDLVLSLSTKAKATLRNYFTDGRPVLLDELHVQCCVRVLTGWLMDYVARLVSEFEFRVARVSTERNHGWPKRSRAHISKRSAAMVQIGTSHWERLRRYPIEGYRFCFPL